MRAGRGGPRPGCLCACPGVWVRRGRAFLLASLLSGVVERASLAGRTWPSPGAGGGLLNRQGGLVCLPSGPRSRSRPREVGPSSFRALLGLATITPIPTLRGLLCLVNQQGPLALCSHAP